MRVRSLLTRLDSTLCVLRDLHEGTRRGVRFSDDPVSARDLNDHVRSFFFYRVFVSDVPRPLHAHFQHGNRTKAARRVRPIDRLLERTICAGE